MAWATCTILHDTVSKIKNVWINKIGWNFIEVSWRLECSELVEGLEGYYLYYCPVLLTSSDCIEPEQTITVTANSTLNGNITNLKPYTRYQIAMAAFTKDYGIGPRSDQLFIHTLETAPDTNGLDVTILNFTSETAFISWNAPTKMNGNFKYYLVENNGVKVGKPNETNFTLAKLKPYTEYNISVSACTSQCSLIDRRSRSCSRRSRR